MGFEGRLKRSSPLMFLVVCWCVGSQSVSGVFGFIVGLERCEGFCEHSPALRNAHDLLADGCLPHY